jgi:pyridoxine 5-phosphate synthase
MVSYPDPLSAARIAVLQGVSCITVHLREDRRHIQDDDLFRIREIENCRLNMEMASSQDIIEVAMKVKPDQVTLVPEKREELTTEGGLDVADRLEFHKDIAERFHDAGIAVSFFIDPDLRQIEASLETKAIAVEINTGAYSEAVAEKDVCKTLVDVQTAVSSASGLGLTVHAGHGLHYKNVAEIAGIPNVDELNIGHSIVSQSVIVGFSQAVTIMMEIIARASGAKTGGSRDTSTGMMV